MRKELQEKLTCGRGHAGRRLFTFVHWIAARLGLADAADLLERLMTTQATKRAAFPRTSITPRASLSPLFAAVGGSFIPSARLFRHYRPSRRGIHLLPNIVLTRLIRRRRRKRLFAPAFRMRLNLLVICVDAGLSIDLVTSLASGRGTWHQPRAVHRKADCPDQPQSSACQQTSHSGVGGHGKAQSAPGHRRLRQQYCSRPERFGTADLREHSACLPTISGSSVANSQNKWRQRPP